MAKPQRHCFQNIRTGLSKAPGMPMINGRARTTAPLVLSPTGTVPETPRGIKKYAQYVKSSTKIMNKYSTTIEALIKQFDFNLSLAKALVEDLTEEQMTTTPSKGHENHPAFTLGHLVSGTSMMLVEDLNDPGFMPGGWKELFLRRGPGDPTLPKRNCSMSWRESTIY